MAKKYKNNSNHKQNNDNTPKESLHTFINPYNFISIESCQREKNPKEGNLTGYLNCSLTTMTPLIMIDSSKKEESRFVKDHFIYKNPFRINGKPAIPASQLRGMIRSKFETLTNSCFSTVDPEMAFVTRSKMTLSNAGLLHVIDKNTATLYEAKRMEMDYSIDKIKSHKSGDVIKFNVSENRYGESFYEESSDGIYTGIFRKGEPFQNKTHDFIYWLIDKDENIISFDSPNKIKVECEDDVMKLYKSSAEFHKANKEQYQKKTIKDDNYNHASYCETEWRPVWWRYNDFSITEGHIYLSLSSNGQLEYGNHMEDLLSKSGKQSYLPCEEETHVCEACKLFGNTQDEYAITSKVRFEDAILQTQTNNYFAYPNELITLPILASPRFTNANFYLYSQDMIQADFNYLSPDYKAKFGKDGKTDALGYKDPVHIRGRKEYWHFNPKKYKEQEGNQNVTVNPLKTNLVFSFRVYFENLTEEELKHLYLSVCLGNDSSHKYYHKLGMGKSLGFGSVKVDVNKIKVKVSNIKQGRIKREMKDYNLSLPKEGDPLLSGFNSLSSQQQAEIKAMYDFDYLKADKFKNVVVDYPRQYNQGKIFQWFQKNTKKTLPFANKNIIQSASFENKKGKK